LEGGEQQNLQMQPPQCLVSFTSAQITHLTKEAINEQTPKMSENVKTFPSDTPNRTLPISKTSKILFDLHLKKNLNETQQINCP